MPIQPTFGAKRPQSTIMYVLISYDVATSTPSGKKRLRRVAKTCLDYGQRVQFSVFECWISPTDMVLFKKRLLDEIDPQNDSLRFYYLGKNWQNKVEHFGTKETINLEDTLVV